MKKRITVTKPSKADMRRMMEEIRYMAPEHIAQDFPSAKERRAIAAVLRWLALNGVVGWRLKTTGHYSTTAMSKRVRRDFGTSDVIVLDDATYEHAIAVLIGKDDSLSSGRGRG